MVKLNHFKPKPKQAWTGKTPGERMRKRERGRDAFEYKMENDSSILSTSSSI